MSRPEPRIGLLGFMLESNASAPVAGEAEFRSRLWLEGEEILADLATETPRDVGGFVGFRRAMDRTGLWSPIPLMMIYGGASGPIEQALFDRFLAEVEARLRAALPLDGVYIQGHGAALGTVDVDPDAALFALVRRIVGPSVPIVATLDLHANVSAAMAEAVDLLISFRTNPHVDMRERGEEAGAAMRELLAGLRTTRALVRLPLLPPQVALRTDIGPYAEAVALGQERSTGAILNVSVLGNFSFSDSAKTGMSVVVTARNDQEAADAVARDIASFLWRERSRLVPDLLSIEAAVSRIADACSRAEAAPILLADVADNPGGGGRGTTTAILRSVLRSGVSGVGFAVHFEAEAAAAAHRAGMGGRIALTLNRNDDDPDAGALDVVARVMGLSDGEIVGRKGTLGGRRTSLGLSAWLRLDERIDIVVISIRMQCFDTEMLEHLGLKISSLRALVVKSRGHFRAGFGDLFPAERIFEIDGPGLTTPVLSRLTWRGVPRPIWPLDTDFEWTPPERVAVGVRLEGDRA